MQYDEVKGNEAFADDFQQAMTYYTKQSLMGGDVPLKDAYDWSKSKCIMVRLNFTDVVQRKGINDEVPGKGLSSQAPK